MVTLRRIYVFGVCFITLLIITASLRSGFDSLLTLNAVGLVWALAVVIALLPIFLGHWLFAEWQARRDEAEARCPERHLYLQAAQAVLTTFSATNLYFGVDNLLRVLIPANRLGEWLGEASPALVISTVPTALVLAGLWAYHTYLIRRVNQLDMRPPAERPHWLAFIFNLGFLLVGMATIVAGGWLMVNSILRLFDTGRVELLPLGVGLLSSGAAVWAFHWLALWRDPNRQQATKTLLQAIYAQLFSAVGWVLVASGLASIQRWFFEALTWNTATTLPTGLDALVIGLPVLVYHEWQVRRAQANQALPWQPFYAAGATLPGLILLTVGGIMGLSWLMGLPFAGWRPLPAEAAWLLPGLLTWAYYERDLGQARRPWLRWGQALAFSVPTLIIGAVGVYRLQEWAMSLWHASPFPLASALSWLVVGVPLYLYYEWHIHHTQISAPSWRWVRWTQSWLGQGLGLLLAVIGSLQSVRWALDGLSAVRPWWIPAGAGLMVMGMLVWRYYRWVMVRQGPDQALLVRVYVYALSALGVTMTTLGLVGTQTSVIALLSRDPAPRLPDALAVLMVGLPLWLYGWRWATRLFRSGQVDEQRSNLRKAYLYLIIYLAVHGAVVTLSLLFYGVLRPLLGLPTSGNLAAALSIVTASVLMWAVHAWTLHGDMRLVGETSLQGRMQRLYWYLVAGVGLLALVLGLAGSVSAVIQVVAGLFDGSGFTRAVREQVAAAVPALAAGLPVWLSAWWPAERAARIAANRAMRGSFLRRAYLYSYLLGSALSVMVFFVGVVFQPLTALLGLYTGPNLLADMAQGLGFTVMGAVVWGYHAWVLRQDSAFNKADEAEQARETASQRSAAVEQLRAQWAGFTLMVVDDGEGALAQRLVTELQNALPHLHITYVLMTPATRADDTLRQANLIVAPWTLNTPLQTYAAPKVLWPTPSAGIHWVGLTATPTPAEVVNAVRRAMVGVPHPPHIVNTP